MTAARWAAGPLNTARIVAGRLEKSESCGEVVTSRLGVEDPAESSEGILAASRGAVRRSTQIRENKSVREGEKIGELTVWSRGRLEGWQTLGQQPASSQCFSGHRAESV